MILLYVAISPTLYGHYSSSEVYPKGNYPFFPEIVAVPNYRECTNTSDCTNVKVTHGMVLKQCNNLINMNSTLIDAFLDLVPAAFKQSYEQIQMENPDSVFCEIFAWLVMKYVCTSVDDCEANCTPMALQ
jgi:hypothetical protein